MAYCNGCLCWDRTCSRCIIRHNTANYWYLCNQNVLPDETKNYVPVIIAAAVLPKHPICLESSYPKKKNPPQTMFPSRLEKVPASLPFRVCPNCVEDSRNESAYYRRFFTSFPKVRSIIFPHHQEHLCAKTKANEPEQIGYNAQTTQKRCRATKHPNPRTKIQ